VIRRPASRQRIGAFETHLTQVQLFDEGFNNPHRIIFPDVILNTFGQQHDLVSIRAFNESLHGITLCRALPHFTLRQVFLHRLGRRLPDTADFNL
jgi:hypothetical protein